MNAILHVLCNVQYDLVKVTCRIEVHVTVT